MEPRKIRNDMNDRIAGRSLILMGLGFALLEVFKQIYLIRNVFEGGYNVWYVPFQLCSMPIYLFPTAWYLGRRGGLNERSQRLRRTLLTFLMDYGFLGGVMALTVRDGFTFPEHPLLTAHGWIWHLGMIAAALLIMWKGEGDLSIKGWLRTLPLFLALALMAEIINVALHGYGDCDMFYISPYHLSSQPVFRDVDAAVGRPAGILIYLGAVCFGAFLSHVIMYVLDRIRSSASGR